MVMIILDTKNVIQLQKLEKLLHIEDREVTGFFVLTVIIHE